MLYSVKIILKDVSSSEIFDFLPFCTIKLHFQHLILAKIQYNEILSIIIGFLQRYEQKFVDIMMLYSAKIFLKVVSSVKVQNNEVLSLIIGFLQPYEQKFVDIMTLYSAKIFLKYVSSIIFLIFYRFSLLKLHFQQIIFANIQYNEILSLIIGFLQPYEQKFVDITMLHSAKIFLKDVSSVKCLIFYRFLC